MGNILGVGALGEGIIHSEWAYDGGIDPDVLREGDVRMASQRAEFPLVLQKGARIADRYVLVRSLGEGGMGQVYEVEHDAIGRHFALKVLNINLDTSNPTGKLMLTMLGAIAQFEREMILERQAEGFAIAKAQGRIKGRKPTARAKSKEIKELVAQGMTKQAVADQLGIGVASVYRVLRTLP